MPARADTAYWPPSPLRRSVLERRHPVPSPDRGPEPEDAVAGVVGLLRVLRVRRLPRHRVQRDPRGRGRHRRQPALQVPDHRPRRDPARRPRDHPRRDEAQGRAGLLHALVRRARQGHRRRHRPPGRRARAPLDRGRSPGPLADDERRRPGRRRSRTSPSRSRRSRSRARSAAPSSRPRPARTSATSATSGAGRRRSAGIEIDVSRTGYTGDLGYELWIPAEHAEAAWDALFEAGQAYAIRPAGMLALDVTRLEAGLILLEVDYTSARHAMNPEQNYSPFEIGLGRLVSFDKADYVGRRALKAEQDAGGPARRLVGLQLDWYDIERLYDEQGLPPAISPTIDRSHVPVFAEAGRQVGKATSHGWSPILKQAIALASVAPRFERVGTRLQVEWTVEGRRGRVDATVVELPFLDLDAQARVTAERRRPRPTSPHSTAWSTSGSSAGPRSWSSSWRIPSEGGDAPGLRAAADWIADRLRAARRRGRGPRGRRARRRWSSARSATGRARVTSRPALRRPAGVAARAVDDAAVRAGDPRRPGVGPRRDRQQGRAAAARSGRWRHGSRRSGRSRAASATSSRARRRPAATRSTRCSTSGRASATRTPR